MNHIYLFKLVMLGIILLGKSACSKNDLGDIDDPNTPAPTQSDYDLYIHHSTANGDILTVCNYPVIRYMSRIICSMEK